MKYTLKTAGISIMLSLAIGQINSHNLYAGALASYYIFLAGMVLCLWRHILRPKHALVTMPITLLLLHILVYGIDTWAAAAPPDDWLRGFLTMPGLFMLPASILGAVTAGGLWGARKQKIGAVALLCGLSLLFVWKSRQWFDQWLFYISFNSLSGQVQEPEPAWRAVMPDGRVIDHKTYDDKVLLLDCWNTGCGVCFRMFPMLDSVYRHYRTNTNVVICALNIPLPSDTAGMALSMIAGRDYTFPVAVGDSTIPAQMGFNGFPTVLLIRHDTIYYRGNLEQAIALLP